MAAPVCYVTAWPVYAKTGEWELLFNLSRSLVSYEIDQLNIYVTFMNILV